MTNYAIPTNFITHLDEMDHLLEDATCQTPQKETKYE
jgi:hypothetical protein